MMTPELEDAPGRGVAAPAVRNERPDEPSQSRLTAALSPRSETARIQSEPSSQNAAPFLSSAPPPEGRVLGLKRNQIKGIGIALAAHLVLFSTGGLLFSHGAAEKEKKAEEVDLVDPNKPPPEQEKPKVEKQLEAAPEQMPDSRELANLDAPMDAPAALDAMSLSDLESALNGAGGGGDFGNSVGLGSGGRIGGTGFGGDSAGILSSGELDQKPRPIFQSAPLYPASVRQRKTGGSVSLMVTVDAQGNVTKVDIEKASDRELESPAIEAVRKWKFEPGMRDGKKVPFKMRVPIKFSA